MCPDQLRLFYDSLFYSIKNIFRNLGFLIIKNKFVEKICFKIYLIQTQLKQLAKNRTLGWTLKIIVFLLLIYVLYDQVFSKENIDEIWAEFLLNLSSDQWPFLALAVLLMPANWLVETQKWRILLKKVEHLTLWTAFTGVMAGVTLSVFTPNRVGEYGGRVLLVKPENRWRSVVATLVGSFAQLSTLLSFGLVGMMYFVAAYRGITGYAWGGMLFIAILLILLLKFCYYNVDLAIPIVRRIPYLKRGVRHLELLKLYTSTELTHALGLAVVRYMVYSLQYYCLLQFFNIEVPVFQGFMCIAFIFLVQTSIPLPALWGLLIRGKLALDVWGIFSPNEIAILASTFSLWFVNLILPALLGMIFITRINVSKTLGYDN